MFFPDVIVFFSSYRFSKRWLHTLIKNSHERAQGKGKGIVKEGKGKNRKGRRKGKAKGKENKGSVSHRPFLMSKVIVFVIVLLSFVNPVCVFLFFWQSSKKGCSDHLPGTFLVQNLRHYDNKQ